MNRHSISAFTKLDMMIVIGMLVMLAVWLVYMRERSRSRPRAARINCVSQLKQVGLGFRMWANDHGDLFPWQVSVAEGGTKEFAHLPYAVLHYVAASNELNSPKILTCTVDTGRTRTNVWGAPLHLSLSYFAGLNADETKPTTVLAGDRNVSTNSMPLVGLLTVDNAAQLLWTKDLHRHQGNMALADGSVAQVSQRTLSTYVAAAIMNLSNQPVRLVIP